MSAAELRPGVDRRSGGGKAPARGVTCRPFDGASGVSRRRPRTSALSRVSRVTNGPSSCRSRGNACAPTGPQRCVPTDGRSATARNSASGIASQLPMMRLCYSEFNHLRLRTRWGITG